jgi:hypothetical protein
LQADQLRCERSYPIDVTAAPSKVHPQVAAIGPTQVRKRLRERRVARREVEVLASPAQVILDIRKDIQNFQAGGPRKELVEALRDQFVATRHQAAVKAEATRMLALDMLHARLPEIKSVSELMRVISALSRNDLAAGCGAVPGTEAHLLTCFGRRPFS